MFLVLACLVAWLFLVFALGVCFGLCSFSPALARCLQFAMHKFRLRLFVKDLEPGGGTTFFVS